MDRFAQRVERIISASQSAVGGPAWLANPRDLPTIPLLQFGKRSMRRYSVRSFALGRILAAFLPGNGWLLMRAQLGRLARYRWIYVTGLALALAGCADTAASSKGHMIQYLAGPKAEAFRKADKGCNQYGRVAEVAAYDAASQNLSFRCIEP